MHIDVDRGATMPCARMLEAWNPRAVVSRPCPVQALSIWASYVKEHGAVTAERCRRSGTAGGRRLPSRPASCAAVHEGAVGRGYERHLGPAAAALPPMGTHLLLIERRVVGHAVGEVERRHPERLDPAPPPPNHSRVHVSPPSPRRSPPSRPPAARRTLDASRPVKTL